MDEWRFPARVEGENGEQDAKLLELVAESRGFDPERVVAFEGEIIVSTPIESIDMEAVDVRGPDNVIEPTADATDDAAAATGTDATPTDADAHAVVLRALAAAEVVDGHDWASATEVRAAIDRHGVGHLPAETHHDTLHALVEHGDVYRAPREAGSVYRADYRALQRTEGITCDDAADHGFVHGPHTGFDVTLQLVAAMDTPVFYPELQEANPAFNTLSGYLSELAGEGFLERIDAPESSRSSVAYLINDAGEKLAQDLRAYRKSRVEVEPVAAQ